MKTEDMHKGLDKPEIRNFLAQGIGHSYEGEVEYLKGKISELEEQLEKAVKVQASCELIESNGWQWFDVSDEVKNYDKQTYHSFVGTEDEVMSVFPDYVL